MSHLIKEGLLAFETVWFDVQYWSIDEREEIFIIDLIFKQLCLDNHQAIKDKKSPTIATNPNWVNSLAFHASSSSSAFIAALKAS